MGTERRRPGQPSNAAHVRTGSGKCQGPGVGGAAGRDRLPAIALALGLSLFVLAVFVHRPGMDCSPKARFHEMIQGQAHRPFVTRALVPAFIRGAVDLVPESAREGLARAVTDSPAVSLAFKELQWEPELATEYAFAVVIMLAALLVFRFGLLALIHTLHAARPAAAYGASLALLPLPVFFRYFNHIYDFATLALFTLGLLFLARRRWEAYLVVFLLATVNKETSILLAVLFAASVCRPRARPWRPCARLLLVQILIYASVRGALSLAFRHNPGSALEFHLIDHNLSLLRPFSIPQAVALFFLVVFWGIRWSEKPLLARQGLLLLVPLVLAAVPFGFLDELRVYYEAYPPLCLLLFHSVTVIWEGPARVSYCARGDRRDSLPVPGLPEVAHSTGDVSRGDGDGGSGVA